MIELLNCDCMEYMKTVPDKFFDLAIVDPPYGINGEIGFGQSNSKKRHNRTKKWDCGVPDQKYFTELKRVSKNQIVFGANYFIEHLGSTRCFIIWDKQQQGPNFSDCEFAWTSFDQVAKLVSIRYLEPYECNIYNTVKRVHPTQKPTRLYKWILHNYGKPDDRILDTHLGSGSIAIACHDLKFDLVGCEIDKDYYDAAVKRFENHKKQLTIF